MSSNYNLFSNYTLFSNSVNASELNLVPGREISLEKNIWDNVWEMSLYMPGVISRELYLENRVGYRLGK